MTDKRLQSLERKIGQGRNFDSPPLHQWHPELSGDIPIRIAANGDWYHDGDPIMRPSLVSLFASILRREPDGDYYLVTPAEKWRIQVELYPLVITDVERQGDLLTASLNTGKTFVIGEEHPLFLEPRLGDIPGAELWHGLRAIFSRAAWYRLIETLGDDPVVLSGNYRFDLTPVHRQA